MSRQPYRAPPSARPGFHTPTSQHGFAPVPSRSTSPESRGPPVLQRPSYENRRTSSRGVSMHGGVVSGQVGGGYGPYSGTYGARPPPPSRGYSDQPPRASSKSFSVISHGTETIESHDSHGTAPPAQYTLSPHQTAMVWSSKDAEIDDHLHNPSPHDALLDARRFKVFSSRGWANMGALVLLFGGLITFFAGYPIISEITKRRLDSNGAWNLGGINASGQVPNIPNLPSLIDAYTPMAARTRTGYDGQSYDLVFSDEFEVEGRTFWPGDDPFWEAVDLHYWATGDYEWYDPDAVTTKGGKLQISITQQPTHGLNFRSGMLQSWNKFCFTGGYIEVSISLPGTSTVPGFWPGACAGAATLQLPKTTADPAQTLGNLGRAGHGATTDGTWPYSYNSCDVGTMRNQTNLDGTPSAARTTGPRDYGGSLSYQPGQRMSACTCPSSRSEHPGPNTNTGRGAPEIDIIEAQVSYNVTRGGRYGTVSQSAQVAPYDASYEAIQTAPQSVIYNPSKCGCSSFVFARSSKQYSTYYNDYLGGIYQQALSGVTATAPAAYGGTGFASYGFEYWPDTSNGYITWQANNQQAWTLNAAAIGPNPLTQVSQRLVSEEPMSIILNLGLSASFQTVDWQALRWPGIMLVDYVRVYQRTGQMNVGCDPKNRPTADYINKHLNAYTNPNLTTWAGAGYTFPVNRLQNGGSCP